MNRLLVRSIAVLIVPRIQSVLRLPAANAAGDADAWRDS